jgi:hypothetical protein
MPNELSSGKGAARVVCGIVVGTLLLSLVCSLPITPVAREAGAADPMASGFSCSPCRFFWGELIQIGLQPSIPDAETVELRLRPASRDPDVPVLPGDLIKLDYSWPFDTAFDTFFERSGGWQGRARHRYLLASAIRADGSRIGQGRVDIFLMPAPSVPRFAMRPLVVAGSPVVKGVRVYRVPGWAEVKVFAFGFRTRYKHRRLAVPVASVRKEGEIRTLLFGRDLTIDPEGAAWLQVLVEPKAGMRRFGVRVRARTLRARLVRNEHGDTVVEQNPDESHCWVSFPTHPVPDCVNITGRE